MPPPPSHAADRTLRTSAGDVLLDEYRLHLAGRTWSVLHTGAVLSYADEQRYLTEHTQAEHTQADAGSAARLPYGVALWPAAIALAHEIAARADADPAAFRGPVLELGAGTGLPGIVAASLGAHVRQTDRHVLALDVCERNGIRNRAARNEGGGTVAYGLADWTAWTDTARYRWILGADILYSTRLHDSLRRIFAQNLAPEGRVLLADPFRGASLPLLEALDADGWRVSLSKWSVAELLGDAADPRPIGVYEVAPPVA